MRQKFVPEPFLILANNSKQLLHERNYLKNKNFERGLSKRFKKLTLFFPLTQSLLMDKVTKNKGDLELLTSYTSGYKTSSEKFFY